MTRLSVNVNKIALLRNSRGGNIPDVVQFARDAERYGAQGITVHPRPDERHIRKSDVYALKESVTTEFNIEGYPSDDFLKMVLEVKPHQCTLVPDAPNQITSDHGWDTIIHGEFLKNVVATLKDKGIRVSLFIDPDLKKIEAAQKTGADRVELYTGPYAHGYDKDKQAAVAPYIVAAEFCRDIGIGLNAGHDLNLDNLQYFKKHITNLLEVSIGHALVRDCLYYGLENTIGLYLRRLSDE
ncbi:MAG: pyridoxine 5'-phosphate synthase [Chitinophagales bacterium]|nr:pyridoxine 5'-phosphate synthase [Chitinophagales bacterium]MDW8419133.1 pyridoxine 5'-phosphate synthase [Chitinophagales bacterium]